MKTHARLRRSWCCLLLAACANPANAQFRLQQSFEGTTAPGWTLSHSAILTAPSIDALGNGWLRLTAAAGAEKGLALDSGFSFGGNQPVVLQFSYVSWGGTGADGMALFLYDSSTVSPMAGALSGGGLGFCGGAGGYLAVGLDEYGNFSNPGDNCGSSGGGPGNTPESLVIRGPQTASNVWVKTTSVPGGIDNPNVASRPSPKTVQLILTPALAPAIGYTITVQFQSAGGQPFQTLFANEAFTYAPPANLSVGISGSTGASTNNHELRALIAATPDDLQVTMTGPASVLQGSAVTYLVTVTNDGNYSLSAGNAPTIADVLPASVTAGAWTCAGTGGATCAASGTGSLDTTNVTLPPNGAVTYTITGTLDPAATCGATIANTANADFGSTTNFLDPDETNNSATVDSTVACDTTLVASPASLTYPPQQVDTASSSQTVTLIEGLNAGTITGIAVTGDYSETNDCPASLGSAQTCTVHVVFTPTALGTRSGTLTIQSRPPASAVVTAVVPLSGTGVNSIPNPFSFTPLVNVASSSVQISNAITVSNTDVPAPISVSAGAQYSVNGGAFTAIPGVVSPGAQVRVQLTAASGYSTSDAAVLTIGGVAATFTVTTGAQPVLHGGFTPVTGAVPDSVQTSNTITVVAVAPAPITVSAADRYSINGGPFTSAPGTVHDGDRVAVQLTAPSTYNTTASAVATIGGITSTFLVTTAAQPVKQAGFTDVSGASVSSSQISNAITITSIAAPAPISISSGAEYSINGGPFTSAQGTVRIGDQVRVELTAAAAYDATATAVLTIGGSPLPFSVTTGAEPVLEGTFAPVTGAATSSVQTSNPVTVMGITGPALVSITNGAEYSVNGGPFTAGPGTIQAGDQVRVAFTAPSTYARTATAVLTVDGVEIPYSVSTGPQPLANVAVTGGGGAIGMLTLLTLALLAVCRVCGARRAAPLMPLAVVVLATLSSGIARADDGNGWSNVYAGIRIGDSTSSMTAAKLSRDLRADGYQVNAAGAERGTAGGTLYLGYELGKDFAVELAGTYIGRTRAALGGVPPGSLGPLLADTAHIVRGSGDIVALEARYRWPLTSTIDLDLRAGPYLWLTTSDVYVSGADKLERSDNGLGWTLGVGPRFALGRHVGIGVSAEYFDSTSQNQFWQFSATLEYHFR
jgi:hypothetical protein